MIYIIPSDEMLKAFRKKVLKKCGTFKEYAKINKISEGAILKRLRGDVAMPFDFFKELNENSNIVKNHWS